MADRFGSDMAFARHLEFLEPSFGVGRDLSAAIGVTGPITEVVPVALPGARARTVPEKAIGVGQVAPGAAVQAAPKEVRNPVRDTPMTMARVETPTKGRADREGWR